MSEATKPVPPSPLLGTAFTKQEMGKTISSHTVGEGSPQLGSTTLQREPPQPHSKPDDSKSSRMMERGSPHLLLAKMMHETTILKALSNWGSVDQALPNP